MPAWTLRPVRRFSRDQQNKKRFACFSVSHFRAKKRRDPLKPTGDRVYVTVFRKETSTELLPARHVKMASVYRFFKHDATNVSR